MADLSTEEINKKIVSFIPELIANDKGSIIKFVDSAQWVHDQLNPNEQKIFDQLIKYRLPGAMYLKISKKDIKDFDMLIKSLSDACMEVKSLDEIYNNCFGCSQEFNESTRNYGYRLADLLDEYIDGYTTKYHSTPDEVHLQYLSEKAVQTFKNGLNNMILREKIVTIKAKNISEILNETEIIEAMLKASTIQHTHQNDIDQRPQQKYFVPPQYCNYCQKINHTWRDCRQRLNQFHANGSLRQQVGPSNKYYPYNNIKNQPIFCTYCNNPGHIEVQCYKKRNQESKIANFQPQYKQQMQPDSYRPHNITNDTQPAFTKQHRTNHWVPENTYNQFYNQYSQYATNADRHPIKNLYDKQIITQNRYQIDPNSPNNETILKANIYNIDHKYSEEDNELYPETNPSEKIQANKPMLNENYRHLGIIPDIYLPKNNENPTNNIFDAEILYINTEKVTADITLNTRNLSKEISKIVPTALKTSFQKTAIENRNKNLSENIIKHNLFLSELPKYQNEDEEIPNLKKLFSNSISECSNLTKVKEDPNDSCIISKKLPINSIKSELVLSVLETIQPKFPKYEHKSENLPYQSSKISDSTFYQNQNSRILQISNIELIDEAPNKVNYASVLRQNIDHEYLNIKVPVYLRPEQSVQRINQSIIAKVSKQKSRNEYNQTITAYQKISQIKHKLPIIPRKYKIINKSLKVKTINEKKSNIFTSAHKPIPSNTKPVKRNIADAEKQITPKKCIKTKTIKNKVPHKTQARKNSNPNKVNFRSTEPETITFKSNPCNVKWKSYYKTKCILQENFLYIMFMLMIYFLLSSHNSIAMNPEFVMQPNSNSILEHFKFKSLFQLKGDNPKIYLIFYCSSLLFYFILKIPKTFRRFQSHWYKTNKLQINRYSDLVPITSTKQTISKLVNCPEFNIFKFKKLETLEWLVKHIPNINNLTLLI